MEKTVALLILFFTINFSNLYAQWFWQNPLPQGNTLNSVDFVNSEVGWAVGDDGTILKTTNGGIDWMLQHSGLSTRLISVHFVDTFTGIAVGDEGTILRTSSGGESWIIVPYSSYTLFSGASFWDNNNGLIVGRDLEKNEGLILKTTDGGT